MRLGPRLKDLGTWSSGGTPPRDDHAAWEGDVPWLSAKDIDGDTLRQPTAFITEMAAARHSRMVPAGSIAMIVRGMALAHGLPVVRTDRRAAFNQDLRALVPGPSHEARFLHYSLRGNRARLGAHIDRAAHGTARVIDSIYLERVWAPPRRSQSVIADFLDRESQRIASALQVAETALDRCSELELAQRREELHIGERSGRAVSTYFRLQRGMDLPDSARTPGPFEVVGSGGPIGTHNEGPIAPPAVVTGRYGSVGHVHWSTRAIWPLNTTLYVSSFHDASPRFAYWVLRSLPLEEEGAKSAVPGIHRGDIGRLRIGHFSNGTQRALVRAFDERDAAPNRLRRSGRVLGSLLAEYRDALIIEAVTGQLDVTGVSDAQMDERLHAAVEPAA